MSELAPGEGADAAAVDLSHAELLPEVVVEGSPTTALLPLATLGGTDGHVEIGIWEMTPGTATDTEADEVFVVLSGAATIRFISPELPALEVGPGSVVRLTEGMQTEWTVTETLRKVYIT
ncbi:cupin domain-containing protein [Microbacterium sp. ZW T5_45]|uniref:cupin domain-containing protein n=1 Tax=Microbacterium sp. ZW T5_45 TaxID=3378080 RepID=UPI0038536A64